VNFHTLRHTFASHYVMRGGSIVTLQAILGYSNIRTAMIYARIALDHLVGATALLEGLGPPSAQRQHMTVLQRSRRSGDVW